MRLRALFLASVTVALPLVAADGSPVARVEAVGMTVSDMDRAIDFYSNVLTFEKMSDREVLGEDFEKLQGVFGSRLRLVRLRLGGGGNRVNQEFAPPPPP